MELSGVYTDLLHSCACSCMHLHTQSLGLLKFGRYRMKEQASDERALRALLIVMHQESEQLCFVSFVARPRPVSLLWNVQ